MCEKDIPCPSGGGTEFRCLQEGSFPDLEECNRYHVCNDKLQHFTDTCGSRYDLLKGECVDGEALCATKPSEKCTQDNSGSKAFPTKPSLYRVCLPQSPPNKGYVPSVMSCSEDQVFDNNEAKCIYECNSAEVKRFRDPLDCHKYYECPGKDKTPERKSCSAGLGYDFEKKMCVQEAKVKACAAATTTTTTTTTTAPPKKIPPTKAPTKAPSPAPVDCPMFTTFRKDLGYCAWGLFG